MSVLKVFILNPPGEEEEQGHVVPLVIMTHKANEGNLQNALQEIYNLETVAGEVVVIRVEY